MTIRYNNPPMKKALIYCRVSSDRQVKEGHGLQGQEQRCRGYADAHGYEVVKVFMDEGVSGGVIDREGMQKLLDYLDIHNKESHIVIIDDIKRLARDITGHFTLRRAISSRKAILESPSHKFGEGAEDIFVESILAATAELERNQNKRQVRNRMQSRLEAGYWTFYPPPGYAFAKVAGHGKIIVPKEPEASIIKEALQGFASGRYATQTDVRDFLQSKGFKHWGYGKMTYLEQVKRLLTREVYAGYIYYPKWNVTHRKGHHQPLISGETFQIIQDKLADKQKARARNNIRDDFPLRGFVCCSKCSNPFTASWSTGRTRKYPFYRCKTVDCEMQNKSIRADKMHDEFEALLKKLKPRANILKVVRAELLDQWNTRLLDVESIRKERQKKLNGIQKEIDGYLTAIKQCSNATVIKKIEESIEALEAKRMRLGEHIEIKNRKNYDFETALNRVFDFIKNPYSMWQQGDLAQKRLVLRLVFEGALTYDKEKAFGTASFSLPINICCIPELDSLEVVEMPGIEPGSNVYTWCSYDHVPFGSHVLIKKGTNKRRE
jgi:site-specific DNA recombinase